MATIGAGTVTGIVGELVGSSAGVAKQAARFGDKCSGHHCWPPRINDQGSPNVFINNIQAHRQGDHWIVHCCDDSCHDSILCAGSPTVFVNGLQLGRAGDPVCCGSRIATGSPNVFCGP